MSNVTWEKIKDYSEIIFERTGKIAKITMNRPEKLNAFTPVTVQEMIDAFTICRDDSSIGVTKVFVEMGATLAQIRLPA